MQQTIHRTVGQTSRRLFASLFLTAMAPLLSGCDAPSLRDGPLSFVSTAGDESAASDLFRRVTQGDEAALAELIRVASEKRDAYAAFYAGLAVDPNVRPRAAKPDAIASARLYGAAQRLPAAKHNLALLLLSGVSYVPPDKSGKRLEPIQLLEESAQSRVESMLLLASIHERGIGPIKPNAALAAQWYSKAIEHSKDRRAQTRLGFAYLEGRGVVQDPIKAHELLLAAAKGGSSEAQYRLALLDQPAIQAAQWFTVAAISDSAHSAAAQAALSKVSHTDQEQIKRRAALWVHAHQVQRPLPTFSEPLKSP